MADEQFYWAVKTGDVANVQAAVEKGVNVNAPDQTIKKRTPLHYAADFGQVEVGKYLVSKGANVNAQDGFGITPLLAAVYEGHKGMVEFLLANGASKDVKGPDGMTAREAANDDEIRDLLQ